MGRPPNGPAYSVRPTGQTRKSLIMLTTLKAMNPDALGFGLSEKYYCVVQLGRVTLSGLLSRSELARSCQQATTPSWLFIASLV